MKSEISLDMSFQYDLHFKKTKMKQITYITMALLFASCTKDMTEVIDVSEIDGTNITIEVFNSNSHIDPEGIRLHEFENGRLILSRNYNNTQNYYYINVISGNVETEFFTHSNRIAATKDYFLYKWSNNVKLMDKNNQEVTTLGSGIYQANPDMFVGQYESNTFMGYMEYSQFNINPIVSLINGQGMNIISDITYSDYSTSLGWPFSNYFYLNKEFLFFVNVEHITSNDTYRLTLNKYLHSLQLVQRNPLNWAVSYQNAEPWVGNHEGNPFRIFPNNNYKNLIISSGTPNNWNIMDDNFQTVGSFTYIIDFNDNDVFFGRKYVSRIGEIVSWNFNEFTTFDINSSSQKTYNIRDEFEISAGIPQNDVYILWVAERKAGGYYVLYQYPESGVYKAYLKIISK